MKMYAGSFKYVYLSTKLQGIRPQNTVIFFENDINFTLFLYNFTTKFKKKKKPQLHIKRNRNTNMYGVTLYTDKLS